MAEINLFNELMEYGSFDLKLKASALIKNNEPIVGGFYPIKVKGNIQYCVLTPRQIILAAKNPNARIIKDYNFELIPLEKLKTISLERHRDFNNLIGGIVTLIASIICAIALILIHESLGSLTDYLLFLTVIIFAGIASIIEFYRFFNGEDMILLKGPGKDVKLQGKYKFWKIENIIFWWNGENGRNLQYRIKDMKHLFHTLMSHVEI